MDDGYPQIIMSGTDPNLPSGFDNSYSKYSQFKPMATGGKAELFSCWDNSLGRLVAVKTLRSEIAQDEGERRRFLREARVTAQLQHPNTVPVYEVGRASDGSIYFTMKRLLGEDLYAVIVRLQKRDGPTKRAYSVSRLVDIVVQVSQAIAYAHSHGVIHRDIKPENIWLGRFGEVLLLDWGVAKVWGQPEEPYQPTTRADEEAKAEESAEVDEKTADGAGHLVERADDASATAPNEGGAAANSVVSSSGGDPAVDHVDNEQSLTDDHPARLATLTRSGSRPGTPLYMSPEQVAGHRYVDERTDVFSMGVVLYELLTLKLPFQGGSIDSTFEKILHDEPVAPRKRSPARSIPEPLERVALKALQKEPHLRHQTMEEFIRDLQEAEASV